LAEAQISAPVTVPDTHTIGPQMEVVAHRFTPLLVPDETTKAEHTEEMPQRLLPEITPPWHIVDTVIQVEGDPWFAMIRAAGPEMQFPTLTFVVANRTLPVTVPDTQTIGPQIVPVAQISAPVTLPDTQTIGPQMEVVAHRLTALTKPLPQTVPEKVLTPATVWSPQVIT